MKKKLLILVSVMGLSFASFIGQADAAGTTYTVKVGDVLWKIAYNNSITTQQLMSWNNLTSDMIYPGQQLYTAPNQNGTSKVHTVQSGETLWIISNKYQVSISDVKKANNLSSDMIYPGQRLTIPAIVKTPVQAPPQLQDGFFPLMKGSYQPFTENYGATREYNPDGSYTTRSHEGIDIMATKGTPVYSATNGKIINKGWSELGGWRLTIQANSTTAVYYAHLSGYAPNINKGDTVGKGQLLGYVGNTGYGPEGTSGKFEPHLHFGMYDTTNGFNAINPYAYLKYWESKNN